MILTEEIGQKVIKRVSEYVNVDINMMNLTGEIIASTDIKRLHEIHQGARKVIEIGEPFTITAQNLEKYPGTKKGVNLPIIHRNEITGVVGVSGTPEEILPITGLVRTAVELVLEQIHFQREIFNEERQWSYWLQQLFHMESYDKQALEETAAFSFNLKLDTDWNVIILFSNDNMFTDQVKAELDHQNFHYLITMALLENETIIITNENETSVRKTVQQLGTVLKNCQIGIGETHFGIDGIRKSYKEAKQALEFSKGVEKISFSKDWPIKRLVTTISMEEYNHICGRYEMLLKNLGEEYIETIDHYFRLNLSIKETAQHLHIHRNTLLYRLEQIKVKVGLDPRKFTDAFLLKLIREYS